MSISSFADQYVSDRVRPFLFLSHPVANSPPAISELWSRYYTLGPDDTYLLIGWAGVLVVLRWITMSVFKKFAHWWLSRKASRGRPAECNDRKVGNGVLQANGVATAVSQNGHAAGNGNGAHLRTGNGFKREDEALATELRRSRAERVAKKASAKRERTATRFAEQGAVVVYYTIAWLFGVWVNTSMYPDGRGPMDTDAYWTSFPHDPLPAPIKAYYFLAFAFYGLQLVILNIEEHRKDHWQMFSHHVITVGLIAWSYSVRLSRPGCAILVLLDFCDILLASAKMAKYMSVPLAPDILFVLFLVSWFVTRQVLLLKIILAVTFDMPQLTLEQNPKLEHYLTYNSWLFLTVSLWLLYAILCVWFWMGCKVAVNVIRGKGAQESRSDDEESDEPSSPTPPRISSKDE